MYLKLIIALFIGINCQVLAITQMRIAQINQFIADLKRNKIPLNVIQSRANNLKKGLSRRELDSSYITNLDDAVQKALSKQIVPEEKEEEEEEEIPAIEEPPVKKTIPGDLAKNIESFAAEIAQNYDDQEFITSPQYKKSVESKYKTVQTQLLKHRNKADFEKYQTILNVLADQFDAIKKRVKKEKEEEKTSKPEDIPLYVEIDKLAEKINNWFTDKAFIPTMKENTETKNTYAQLLGRLIEFQKSSPYYDMYYGKLNKIAEQLIEINNRKPLASKVEKPEVKVESKVTLDDIKKGNLGSEITEKVNDILTADYTEAAKREMVNLATRLKRDFSDITIEAGKEVLIPISKTESEARNIIESRYKTFTSYKNKGFIPEVKVEPKPEIAEKKGPEVSKEEKQLLEFGQLITRSKTFALKINFPTKNNLISAIAMGDEAIKRTITQQAKTTHPIMHSKVSKLISDFLAYKKQNGTQQEKNVYKSIPDSMTFISRLLQKRPLMFMGTNDQYLLRNGKTTGFGGFEAIGTPEEQSSLTMANYLTYDEMQVSALLGVSVPTYFINNGNRNNRGITGAEGSYESQGIYVGLVGARFEKENLMEWAHIMITPEQNTSENGYGANPSKQNPLLDIWARFYETTFPTFQEAQQDTSGNYISINQKQYFNKEVYKKRMKMVIEPFLLDANERGKEVNKKVYAHIVGLGLGVWQKFNKQPQLLVDVYADILKNNALAYIQTLNFSYFPADVTSCGGIPHNGTFTAGGNNIKILFSKRDPADPLENKDLLLVAQYAWDGNSYPGNEYWMGMLAASGDPAAASCSTIPELQNPEINLNVSGKFIKTYGNR